MPMRATTVRFSEDLWQLLEAEAQAQGISSAQFVRDATIMRLGVLVGRRGDPEATITLEALAAGALALRRTATDGERTPPAVHDPERLAELRRVDLLDTPAEEPYDRLARLAAKLLHAPVALVSLVDENRQFFKSCFGLGEPWSSTRQTPLSHSFCQHALEANKPLVIENAHAHPLVRDNAAIRDLGVVAYAGVPLTTGHGQSLGTLCVIDHKPRTWSRDQIDTLIDLAASVMTEIELHAAHAA
jgi:GAF domain-containing protein